MLSTKKFHVRKWPDIFFKDDIMTVYQRSDEMMDDELRRWYTAFKAKDTRFDGRLFVGVSSTGIYCRPVCRAKLPKIENCSYYKTAASAEQAGYRPCLICRPELAPGTSITDAADSLARRAVYFLEKNCDNEQSLKELAASLGCTDRHLRRVFKAHYQVSPVQYLQTCKLLLAKSLLTDTSIKIIDVAMTAGFGSLRRFNALFKKQYRFSPTDLRKQTAGEYKSQGDITLSLGYRPPYPWSKMLDFFSQRAITGVELIKDGKYWRTVHLITSEKKNVYGWICVAQDAKRNILNVTIATSLLPVLPQVLARLRHLFDLYCDPDAVYEVLSVMNDIRPGLSALGTRLPGCFDSFELSVRAVLGQQITIKAARTLALRLVNTYGTPVQTGIKGLFFCFPFAEDIVVLDGEISEHLGPLGITSARAKTILALARAYVQGDINFDFCAKPDIEIEKLRAIPGIGNWTAQYIAMRTMAYTDAFLQTDAGIKKALKPHSPKKLLDMAEAWRPWRSYATINLWNSL